jgi:hypothetical protein
MSYLSTSPGDANYLGYFIDPAALEAAYPVAVPGAWAIVGSTNTLWAWNEGTMAWVNTGNPPPIGPTGSTGPTGPTAPRPHRSNWAHWGHWANWRYWRVYHWLNGSDRSDWTNWSDRIDWSDWC